MSVRLSKKSIKQWCGTYAYQNGERLSRTKKVRFVHLDFNSDQYVAELTGTSLHQVSISLDTEGKPDAQCDCPTLGSYDLFCQHIAAVLIRLYEIQQSGSESVPTIRPITEGKADGMSGSKAQMQLADRILGLFEEKPVRPIHNKTLTETRTPLEAQFILKLLTLSPSTAMFGLELKVGPKALYIVHNIVSFLDQLVRGEGYSFSSKFSYDPELHSFEQANEAVLQALIQIVNNHAAYREADRLYTAYSSGWQSDRMLLIPPQAWADLRPLLDQAPKVTLMDGSIKYDGITVTMEPLPLSFELKEARTDGYELCIQGLEPLTIMEPYEMVFLEGRLFPLPTNQCKRLTELKAILDESGMNSIPVPSGHLGPFVEKAVPGFQKLGFVSIAPTIAKRVTQSKLQAKLYLDRIKDRLLAAVEFQYDEVVINPLDDLRNQPGSHRIMIRDSEKEQHILKLIEQCPFMKTEGGYILSDEEAEFEFLYQVVPQLEKLLKVYATTAVKLRLQRIDTLPQPNVRVAAAKEINWLEFRLNMGWIPETEIRSLVQSIEEKRRYYRLPNGSLMPLDSEELRQFADFLRESGLLYTDLVGSTAKVPIARAVHLLDHSYSGLKLDKPVRQLLDHLRHPDSLDFPVPDRLTNILRDYQKTGYQWLKTLAHYGFGGILADDMGLGKTLQSIAYIVSILPELRKRRSPALVICPGSLVYNWRNELRKFAPEIRVMIADGSVAERAKKMQQLAETDLVITSYPLLLRDVKLYAKQVFHTLILDEAQTFKNHTTQTAQAVKAIPADYRFALTGTPVENRIEELWSIFDVVFPALFQDLKAFANLTQQEITKRARPFMLRRWKKDVLQDLPDKLESIKPTELYPEQKKLYTAYLAKLQQETLKHLSVDGYNRSRIKILAGLTRLRQICCHPALFVTDYRGGSAKLEQLKEIVGECLANRKRMLIFSQFTSMLGLIAKELADLGLSYFYLDGSTPTRERVDLCSRFNDGEMDIFLISMKAGGTGLNLTGADTVVLYDLWWNPAVEQQAADRAHRIGQKNVVQIIRLITQGTMEEKMYELQHRKKHLIDEVLAPQGEETAMLTEQDIREILMI
jgi:SNF2 family DNA or RNA helicase